MSWAEEWFGPPRPKIRTTPLEGREHTVKQRVLFVDDEPNVLQGLRRMLHPFRHEWEMTFVESGEAALRVFEETPQDVLVTDMRMPGMSGADLLERVMRQHPQVVRIVLSGHTDNQVIMRSVGLIHQFLAKPCDAATLKNTVTRACALRQLLANDRIKRLVTQVDSLPALPHLYTELLEELQSPKGSLQKVGDIIAKDVGMTAKILQLVNSAFFGLTRHVSTPGQAVSWLGIDTVKALVLSVQVFSQFRSPKSAAFNLEALWNHSMSTGALARLIAKEEKAEPYTVDDAFLAGMLHDIGKLVLVTSLQEQSAKAWLLAREKGIEEWVAERDTLETTHAEVGAYLVGLWGLSHPIVEGLAYHHSPANCLTRTFVPLTAVHAANAIVKSKSAGEGQRSRVNVDEEYLGTMGLQSRVAVWKDLYEAAA